jgi:hypothetical protein
MAGATNGILRSIATLVAALACAPFAACGGGDTGDDIDVPRTDGCGVADPETGDALFCSPAGNEMCVCGTGRCARFDLGCGTSYRYAEGLGECVPEEHRGSVIVSESGADFCPTQDADADADVPDRADSDVDGEVPPGCGNGVHDPGEDCDRDPPANCDTGCGSTGTSLCVACHWDPCVPPDEICNGDDDDCNGMTDEGFGCPALSTGTCPTGCDTEGTRLCSEACSWGTCAPPDEICNGVDDDCNDVCDDGFECCAGEAGDCTTSCRTVGTRACSAACAWQDCIAPIETCNLIDDDCDELTDEVGVGFACGDGCCNGGETYCSCLSDCTTVVPPPATPQPLSPWNGTLIGSYRTTPGLRPRFQWAPSASGGCGTTTYEIQVDDSCTATGFYGCTLLSPEASASGLTVTTWVPSADLPVSRVTPVGRRYFWRVRACDGAAGCSAWSEVRYVDAGRVPSDFDGDGFSDAAIGVPGNDEIDNANTGAVYVFVGGPLQLAPTYTQRLLPAPLQPGAAFGTAVATADFDADGYGDLAVGAPGRNAGTVGEGGLFVFFGSSTGLTSPPRIVLDSPRGTAGAGFGTALAAVGDVNADGYQDLVVGSPSESVGGLAGAGRVDLFLGSGGFTSMPTSSLTAPVPQVGAAFGRAVAGAGDLFADGHRGILVGAPLQDGTGTDEGAAYVFRGRGSGADTTPWGTLECPGHQAGARFGGALVCIGDLGDDGYPDLAVGAPRYDAGGTDEGNVFVFAVTAAGLSTSPGTTLDNPTNQANAEFGSTLAPTGRFGPIDVEGLAVGAPAQTGDALNEGAVFVYSGYTGLPATGSTIAAPDAEVTGLYGAAVGGALDFNGDGAGDLIVGAPERDGTAVDEGKAFAYLGPSGAGGWPAAPSTTLDNPLPYGQDRFGYATITGR